jgi:hypothetical protein
MDSFVLRDIDTIEDYQNFLTAENNEWHYNTVLNSNSDYSGNRNLKRLFCLFEKSIHISNSRWKKYHIR